MSARFLLTGQASFMALDSLRALMSFTPACWWSVERHALAGHPGLPLLTCRRQFHASGKSLGAACAAASRLACC